MANVIPFGRALIVPDHPSETRIHSPNLVRHGEIEDAIHFERRGFDRLRMGLKYPGQTNVADVLCADLVRHAEAAPRIVAVISGPRIGGRLEKGALFKYLPLSP